MNLMKVVGISSLVVVLNLGSIAQAKVSAGLFPTMKAFELRYSSGHKYRQIFTELMKNKSRITQGENSIAVIAASTQVDLDLDINKLTNATILKSSNLRKLQGSDSARLASGSSIYDDVVHYDMMKSITVLVMSCDNKYKADVEIDRPSTQEINVSMLAHGFTCIFRDSLAKVKVTRISNNKSRVSISALFLIKGSTLKKVPKVFRGNFVKQTRSEIRNIIRDLESLSRTLQ